MSMHIGYQAFDGLYQSSFPRKCGPYEPSIASSASSSQASIFSDTSSVQSSIASSISDDFRHNQDDARDRSCAQAQLQQQLSFDGCKAAPAQAKIASSHNNGHTVPQSYADVTSIPKDQRQHPRRSSKGSKPPSLDSTKQGCRKENFVESLVDSATQMVEVIWPLSVVPCKSEGSSGRGVLPLRTYIEETLRRSRTSYSTLQVALYYLILIKPFVPMSDFTQEQRMDCPASRALMCGRRVFLAALILASKYLQDRNYSTKAWSKMSGLRGTEINANEMTFLSKVQWKLHIPDSIFKRWTDIVLTYTPNIHPPPPGQSFGVHTSTWKSIIPILTPDLEKVPIPESSNKPALQCPANYGLPSPTTPTPTRSALKVVDLMSTSHESTPTPTTALPRLMEPKSGMLPPSPPALARMGPLPTPQLTPSSVASSTPAASTCTSRRPSMCSAMAMAQSGGFNRCAIDTFPGVLSRESYLPISRRPSIASSRSSPESMITDRSRSSRASSISSVSTVSSTSSLAPNRACLARQATCRNARLPLPPAIVAEEKEGTAYKPILIVDDSEMVSSPDMADFTISEKVASRPDKHSKHAPQPASGGSAKKGQKRPRSHGGRRSDLQEEVRYQLQEAENQMMEIDDDDDVMITLPSSAADYATSLLSRSNSVIRMKELQPPASLSRTGSGRRPMQRQEGTKRTCLSTTAMSISPAPLYGKVA